VASGIALEFYVDFLIHRLREWGGGVGQKLKTGIWMGETQNALEIYQKEGGP
jgi:hypothetical protein